MEFKDVGFLITIIYILYIEDKFEYELQSTFPRMRRVGKIEEVLAPVCRARWE